MDKDEPYVRIAFGAFTIFYTLHYRKVPTQEMFRKSTLYLEFVRFGRYMVDLRVHNPDQYAEFLIRNSIPAEKWCSDAQYLSYRNLMTKKMTVEESILLGIETAEAWGKEKDRPWVNFFREVHPNLAVDLIVSGKINPVFLYCSSSKDCLLSRLNEEQKKILDSVVDWKATKAKMTLCKDDAKWASQQLREVGI